MNSTVKDTLRVFWDHARKYKGLFLLILAAITGAMIIEMVVPLYYKHFFDLLEQSHPGQGDASNQLSAIIITILLLHGVQWIFWRVSAFVNNYFQPRVMADIYNSSFEYLQGHSFGFFINQFVGSLVRKVGRLVNGFEGISDILYWDLYTLLLRLIIITGVLWYENWVFAVIILVWTLLYVAIMYKFAMYKMKFDRKAAEIDSKVTGYLADTMTNNLNIKLFTSLKDEYKGFSGVTNEQFKIAKFTWDLGTYNDALQAAFMVLLEFIIFYVAIRYWNKGLITIGTFVLIQAYILQIFSKLWDLGRVIRRIYRMLADAKEMVDILKTPHQVADKPQAKQLVVTKGEVQFAKVNFAYNKTREVLHNFNLTIAPGEKIGVVGPSGAGKSTIVSLIFRFFDVQSGAIFIDGQSIADVTQDSLREHISLVPQDSVLFHRSLMENIRYGKRTASDKDVMKAAKLAHCDDFIERLPEKFQTFVGERGIKLSGGERQRVAIARALLKNAPILVLDEATSSLDSRSEQLIQDALYKLMEGRTTIVIAHRLSTIMKMDRIVVVDEGAIKEQGTHKELLKKQNGLYKKLWDLQVGGFIK